MGESWNTLRVVPAKRAGGSRHVDLRRGIPPFTAEKSERDFLDVEVDDCSLYQTLTRRGYDLVTPFGWEFRQQQRDALARLTLRAPPDFSMGCVSLFVCPECGDLNCGAIAVDIAATDEAVEWRGFVYDDLLVPGPGPSWLEDLGPFRFRRTDYEAGMALLAKPVDAARDQPGRSD